MTTTVKVPARIIWLLDQQIKKQATRVANAQRVLDEMRAARTSLEPLVTPHGNSGKSRGGHARAEALSPEQRTAIAQKGARARWEKHSR
jgi:hypothetical protein